MTGGVHAASPPPEFELTGSDLGVRLFYSSLRANDYFGKGAPNGSGVFAVTETGRARWGAFPKVIADDGFVERQFAPGEARTSSGPGAVVRAPRTFSELLAIKTRARLGKIELAARFPDLDRKVGSRAGRTYARMLASPRLWPAVPVYTVVRLVERRRAARLAREEGFGGWLRDEGSRRSEASVGG